MSKEQKAVKEILYCATWLNKALLLLHNKLYINNNIRNAKHTVFHIMMWKYSNKYWPFVTLNSQNNKQTWISTQIFACFLIYSAASVNQSDSCRNDKPLCWTFLGPTPAADIIEC